CRCGYTGRRFEAFDRDRQTRWRDADVHARIRGIEFVPILHDDEDASVQLANENTHGRGAPERPLYRVCQERQDWPDIWAIPRRVEIGKSDLVIECLPIDHQICPALAMYRTPRGSTPVLASAQRDGGLLAGADV